MLFKAVISQNKKGIAMKEEKLKELLGEIEGRMTEPVRPSLADDIKHQIPQRLYLHRGSRDTINIIIDLRVSKLAAAAVIIVTVILCANFFGLRGSTGRDIIQAIEYSLVGEKACRSEVLADMSKLYEGLLDQGKKVVYYGDSFDPEDRFAVIMHWKLPDGRYRVIFSDLRVMTVSADVLIILQNQMIRNGAK